MFKFTDLKQIHLEVSNNCQASCPMCSRNISGGLENPLIKVQNWSFNDFKNIMNQEVFDQIARYNLELNVPNLWVTNGLNHFFAQIDYANQSYSFLKEFPEE